MAVISKSQLRICEPMDQRRVEREQDATRATQVTKILIKILRPCGQILSFQRSRRHSCGIPSEPSSHAEF